MASAGSDGRSRMGDTADRLGVTAVKILVAGGFGAGKTTLVGAVSEVPPLHTEEYLSVAGVVVDDVVGVERKESTTVALDFGRITLAPQLVLYLFGTPGQERFRFLWDELAEGSIGAVVLADPRRLEGCFPSVDLVEQRGVPFVVAVNRFDGAPEYAAHEVREALDVDAPVVSCDVRRPRSVRDVLVVLAEHALSRALVPGRA